MADSIKSSFDLSVGLDYIDAESKEKTLYLKIPNPRTNLTESEIRTAIGNALAENVILSPENVAFTATDIGTAYTTRETEIDIDIGYAD